MGAVTARAARAPHGASGRRDARAPHDASGLLGNGPALRALARAGGYLYLPGLLAPHELGALRADVLALCAALELLGPRDPAPRTRARHGARVATDRPARARPGARLEPYSSPPWIALQQRIALSAAFTALGEHPMLLAALRTVFDAPPTPHCGDVCRVFLPGAPEQTTPAHQDLFFLRRSGLRAPETVWSAWIPLDDGPPALGGVALVPGSHRRGLRTHREDDPRGERIVDADAEPWVALPMRRGDVALMSCLTIHRGVPNRTRDRIRLSVDYRYQPATAAAHRTSIGDRTGGAPPAEGA